jgi:hypothetical protein
MRDDTHLRCVTATIALALALASITSAPVARADLTSWATGPSILDEEGRRDWGFEIVPYLWIAGLEGEIGIPNFRSTPVDVEFSDLASNLDSGVAGLMDFRYRRWHLLVDGSWVQLTANVTTDAPVVGSASITPSVAFGTVGVSYELPMGWPAVLELYLAARWWHVTATAAGNITAPPIISGSFNWNLTETWASAIVGTRLRYAITDKWRVSLVGDIGAGQANLDWQAAVSLTWMFHKNIGVTGAYRILGVEYGSSTLIYNMRQSGFLLGFNFAY